MRRFIGPALACVVVFGACSAGQPVELTTAGAPPPAPPQEVPTTTTAPAPTTTTAAPTTTTAVPSTTRPRPAPKPAPVTTSSVPGQTVSASFGPRPQGSLVFPYRAGRSSWEGVSEGTSLRLRIEPTAPRTGEMLHIFVEAHHPDRPICGQSVLFGDGSGQRAERAAGTAELTRVFNRPGRFEFLYQAIVGACGDHNLYPSMYGWIDVAAGSAPTSQGPAQPTVEALEQRAPNEPAGTSTLKAWAKGRDPDGYIHRFLIDWGDGSPIEEAPNVAYGFDGGCKAGPSGWPVRPEAWTNYQQPPTHTYAVPGVYTVTVTAVSAGCDGRDEQRATATFTYGW